MTTSNSASPIVELAEELRQLWHDGFRAENVLLRLGKPGNEKLKTREHRRVVPTEIRLEAFEKEAKDRAGELEDYISRLSPQTPEDALVLAALAEVVAERLSNDGKDDRRLGRMIGELRTYLARQCGKSPADLGLVETYGPMHGTWSNVVEKSRRLLDELEPKLAPVPQNLDDEEVRVQ